MNNYKYNKNKISFCIKELAKDLMSISIRLTLLILKGKLIRILINSPVIVLRRKASLRKITSANSLSCLKKSSSIKVNRKFKES